MLALSFKSDDRTGINTPAQKIKTSCFWQIEQITSCLF